MLNLFGQGRHFLLYGYTYKTKLKRLTFFKVKVLILNNQVYIDFKY